MPNTASLPRVARLRRNPGLWGGIPLGFHGFGPELSYTGSRLSLVSPRMRQRETARLNCPMRTVRRDMMAPPRG